MSVPYIFRELFEAGTMGGFDSEVDTNGKLDFPHYTALARRSPNGLTPYQGSYAMHVDLAGGTADVYVEETGGFDMALNAENWVRFAFFAKGLTMTASDRFTIFAMQSAGPVDEVVVDIRNNAGTLQILAAETGAAATVRASDLIQGVWHVVELSVVLDDGVSNDGSITFYLDGQQVGTAITGLDQAAIAQARLGAIGIDAGTTAGHLVFDDIIFDDTRIGAPSSRFPRSPILTHSTGVFVGPGVIEGAALLSTGASNRLRLYDTDQASVIDEEGHKVDLEVTQNTSIGGPVVFQRGCYARITGTDPRCQVFLGNEDANFGPGPVYYSEHGYKDYGLRRTTHMVNY